jgi:transposase-like protein
MRDDKSDVFVWLNHLQEELLDASLYLQRLKEEISTLREEKALLQELNDIDVIDAFEFKVKKKKRNLKERFGPGGNYFYTIKIDD